MNRLRVAFAPYWQSIQHALFPQSGVLRAGSADRETTAVGADPRGHPRRRWSRNRCFRVPGRPPKDRAAMARALVAKAVYDIPTTRVLRDPWSPTWRCGASEAGSGRARCRASRSSHAPRRVLGHAVAPARARSADREHPPRPWWAVFLFRDSTAIEAREKPAANRKASGPPPKRKRGRPTEG